MQTNTSTNMLDINQIVPNKYQPRKVFDEKSLDTLAESIQQYGIINPILVRKKEDKYEIIAGERRYRAAKKIGLTKVPVIIKNADEQEMAELALIENIQRQGLSPIEEAKSYEEIMRIGNQTQESLAIKIGKSQATIANKIRLLSLPQEIQDALANKKISERHARSLLSVKNEKKQIELLNKIMTEKLTVKETDNIINTQEPDEDEIKQAISDIMKSLNIKEEEKEEDNMNNGNFFPNFDNNNTMNNNTSLNMMNMQSMNQQSPMEPAPEMVMPTNNNVMPEPSFPTFGAPMDNSPMNVPMNNGIMEQNMGPMPNDMNKNFNPMAGFMNPTDNIIQPAPQQPIVEPSMNIPEPVAPVVNQINEQPVVNDIPLFGVEPQQPMNKNIENSQVVPPMEPVAPMIDVPLFNPEVVMPGNDPLMNQNAFEAPLPEPTPVQINSFEIPVVNPQPEIMSTTGPAPIEKDRLTELQDLLTANGYSFKTFSNETENCIIIELPRN